MIALKSICPGPRGIALLGFITLASCSSRPASVESVDINPAEAAAQAIADGDKDNDGKLSVAELRAFPGILKWKQLYDLDSDGFVTEEEIAERLKKCQADKIGFRSLSASVKLDGRPLPNVHIVLTPEAYLGDGIKVASGTTNERGFASLVVAAGDLPAALKQRGIKVSGVYPGTYKIAVSLPQRKLPNVDDKGLPLGDEIARDTVVNALEISLSSRQ